MIPSTWYPKSFLYVLMILFGALSSYSPPTKLSPTNVFIKQEWMVRRRLDTALVDEDSLE